MQSSNSNFKKLLFFVNSLVACYFILEFVIPWLFGGYSKDIRVILLWTLSYLFIYIINYFFITPYVFRNGFSLKKILLLIITVIVIHMIISFLLKYWTSGWDMNKDKKLDLDFAYYVWITQAGFFYFLFSTGMRVIQIHLNNQLQIENLTSEQKKIDLQKLQTSIESDLIFKYINYLQRKNETLPISEEIVELSDFLRYTTYRSDSMYSAFQSELKELKRFKEVIYKSNGPRINIENNIEENPLIPSFGLLTPLKELLLKISELKEVTIFLSGTKQKIKMIIETDDLLRDDLNFEFATLNQEKQRLEVEIT